MGFLHAEIFVWSESQLVLGRSFAFLEKAKTDIKEVVLARTGIPINAADPTGKGGAHGRACPPQFSGSIQGVALQAVGVSEGVHLNF